jgi:hypothetical protein
MPKTDPITSAQPSSALHTERRAYVRLASDLAATCSPAGRLREPGWPARVRDIAAGGVGLFLQHRFRPGTALTIELRASTGKLLCTVTARVAHATAVLVDGHHGWLLGCAFDCPLAGEEFAALQ